MFPDSPFAPSTGSYPSPVDLPAVDPDADPTISVSINCSWLPYIRGALKQLLLQATWKTDDPDAINLAQQRVFNLIDLFPECDTGELPFACNYDYTVGQEGWNAISPYSNSDWLSGVGWQSIYVGPGDRAWMYIELLPSTPNVISRVEFTYNSDHAGSGSNNFADIYLNTGSGYTVVQAQPVLSGSNTVVWSGSESNVVGIRMSVNTGDADATFVVINSRVRGVAAESPC